MGWCCRQDVKTIQWYRQGEVSVTNVWIILLEGGQKPDNPDLVMTWECNLTINFLSPLILFQLCLCLHPYWKVIPAHTVAFTPHLLPSDSFTPNHPPALLANTCLSASGAATDTLNHTPTTGHISLVRQSVDVIHWSGIVNHKRNLQTAQKVQLLLRCRCFQIQADMKV